jgi:hypothetical protein
VRPPRLRSRFSLITFLPCLSPTLPSLCLWHPFELCSCSGHPLGAWSRRDCSWLWLWPCKWLTQMACHLVTFPLFVVELSFGTCKQRETNYFLDGLARGNARHTPHATRHTPHATRRCGSHAHRIGVFVFPPGHRQRGDAAVGCCNQTVLGRSRHIGGSRQGFHRSQQAHLFGPRGGDQRPAAVGGVFFMQEVQVPAHAALAAHERPTCCTRTAPALTCLTSATRTDHAHALVAPS